MSPHAKAIKVDQHQFLSLQAMARGQKQAGLPKIKGMLIKNSQSINNIHGQIDSSTSKSSAEKLFNNMVIPQKGHYGNQRFSSQLKLSGKAFQPSLGVQSFDSLPASNTAYPVYSNDSHQKDYIRISQNKSLLNSQERLQGVDQTVAR